MPNQNYSNSVPFLYCYTVISSQNSIVFRTDSTIGNKLHKSRTKCDIEHGLAQVSHAYCYVEFTAKLNSIHVFQLPTRQFWDSGGVKLESLCNFSIVGCQWTVNCLLGLYFAHEQWLPSFISGNGLGFTCTKFVQFRNRVPFVMPFQHNFCGSRPGVIGWWHTQLHTGQVAIPPGLWSCDKMLCL